ncbi:class I SAM-dependent methyltransferase [Clostridiaceae bacterium]|jgi:cyclopropane-fatty-acyl-phospholipid synthase|nr:class I SAM-dependent methyltransferase [Lachnospiraceae bacterium]NBH19004.1 class I SAM-dependent methyltransferase [Clostridiaceae bacterium]
MRGKSYIGRYLQEMIPVAFELETANEFQMFGTGPAQFKVKLKEEIPRRELLRSTSLALGEAYIRGDLEVDQDLYEVLDMFMGQIEHFHLSPAALRGLRHTCLGAKNQKEEVCSHYDIGNDFYRLWLDETMSYSCGYFKNSGDTLFEAQVGKVDHILQKLHLEMGMTLLDIGCGWGFLLMRAAKRYGVKGVGITLSEEQYQYFSREIKDQHMEDFLEVRKMDYRELEKSGLVFDRIVSVGMVEHVGRGNYEQFLENVEKVLRPGGLFLLHFISSLRESEGDPFIRKYIFPGGVIPSLREIIELLPEYDFYTLDVESLRRHYTKTLLCWRENFLKHKKEITEKQGEEFVRMWELYLASCAAAFHNGVVDLHQILVSRGVNNDLPMARRG